jgi:hypothetical protein
MGRKCLLSVSAGLRSSEDILEIPSYSPSLWPDGPRQAQVRLHL